MEEIKEDCQKEQHRPCNRMRGVHCRRDVHGVGNICDLLRIMAHTARSSYIKKKGKSQRLLPPHTLDTFQKGFNKEHINNETSNVIIH